MFTFPIMLLYSPIKWYSTPTVWDKGLSGYGDGGFDKSLRCKHLLNLCNLLPLLSCISEYLDSRQGIFASVVCIIYKSVVCIIYKSVAISLNVVLRQVNFTFTQEVSCTVIKCILLPCNVQSSNVCFFHGVNRDDQLSP